MTKKKKIIIALSAMGVTAVGVIVALIAVIAAFTANTTSNFSVTYTAINVKATVTAEYWYYGLSGENELGDTAYEPPINIFGDGTTVSHGTIIQTTDNQDSMVFTGEESDDEVTKAFKRVELDNIKENPREEGNFQGFTFYVMYQIKNDSTTDSINLQSTLNTTTNNNASVRTAFYAASVQSWFWNAYQDITDVVIAPGEIHTLYFQINLPVDESGSFDGAWNFVLSVAD